MIKRRLKNLLIVQIQNLVYKSKWLIQN